MRGKFTTGHPRWAEPIRGQRPLVKEEDVADDQITRWARSSGFSEERRPYCRMGSSKRRANPVPFFLTRKVGRFPGTRCHHHLKLLLWNHDGIPSVALWLSMVIVLSTLKLVYLGGQMSPPTLELSAFRHVSTNSRP